MTQWKMLVWGAAMLAALVGPVAARADLIRGADRGPEIDPPAGHTPSPDQSELSPSDSIRLNWKGGIVDTRGPVPQPVRIDDSSGVLIPAVVSHLPERSRPDRPSPDDPRPITLEPIPTHLVPEPASFGLIGIASAFLLYRKPRR
jgi:hypothetical protein